MIPFIQTSWMARDWLKETARTVEKYSGAGAVVSFVADNLVKTLARGDLTTTLATIWLVVFSSRKLIWESKST